MRQGGFFSRESVPAFDTRLNSTYGENISLETSTVEHEQSTVPNQKTECTYTRVLRDLTSLAP